MQHMCMRHATNEKEVSSPAAVFHRAHCMSLRVDDTRPNRTLMHLWCTWRTLASTSTCLLNGCRTSAVSSLSDALKEGRKVLLFPVVVVLVAVRRRTRKRA